MHSFDAVVADLFRLYGSTGEGLTEQDISRWSELIETDQGFVIKGSATDVGLVGDLMSKLGQTIYFKEVSLKSTSNDPSGTKAIFELTARRE